MNMQVKSFSYARSTTGKKDMKQSMQQWRFDDCFLVNTVLIIYGVFMIFPHFKIFTNIGDHAN